MTLREWLRKGEQQLGTGPHPDRARRDAETLLLLLVGKSRAWMMAHLDEDFAGCTAIRFASLLDRRHRGEPIQYITGECEFYGLPFSVTRDVLIPRPETEHLVEKVIALAERFDVPRIVDIGTGSGAIAVALAHHLPAAEITATDLSEAALTIARENAQRNGVEFRIRFLQGDLLAPLAGEHFDLVVANPPYVPTIDRDSMSVEVRDHEPALALFAGVDGLDVYRHLISAAPSALVPGGFIALEIGYGQARAAEGLLAAAGFRQIEFIPDLQDIPRVAFAVRSAIDPA
jgi:release factor glutamine methyltransferase